MGDVDRAGGLLLDALEANEHGLEPDVFERAFAEGATMSIE